MERQLQSKAYANPMQVPFLAYSMERTYNGFGTVLQRTYSESSTNTRRRMKIGKYELEKNFFEETLHPYISTSYIPLRLNHLQRFQIYANPTPTLHQPYTFSAFVMQKINNL